MKLDFETNTAVDFYTENGVAAVVEPTAGDRSALLDAGIKAAQAGNRQEARIALLRVTEIEPDNEDAWLWLASISEYPEELLVFLNNVLDINPRNERALEWAQATKSLLAKTFVGRGIEAAEQQQKDFARQCFLQAIVQDARSEMAWLWLASLADVVEEKISNLQKVLHINPENDDAAGLLKSAKRQVAEKLLRKANSSAIAGEHAAANEMLEEVFRYAPDFEDAWILKAYLANTFSDKINCYEKILTVNPYNETAQAGLDSLRAMMLKAKAEISRADVEEYFEDEVPENESELDFAINSAAQESEEPSGEENLTVESNEEIFAEELMPNQSADENYETAQEDAEVEDTLSAQYLEIPAAAEKAAETNLAAAELELAVSPGVAADAFEMRADADERFEIEDAAVDFALPEVENDFALDLDNDAEEVNYYEDSPELFETAAPSPMPPDEPEDGFATIDEAAETVELIDEFAPAENFAGGNRFDDDAEAGFFAPIEESVEVSEAETEEAAAEDLTDEDSPKFAPMLAACSFCMAENEANAVVCHSCRAVLSLADLEMLLANGNADREILRQSIGRLEAEKAVRDFDADEIKMLAVGQINLKNLPQGFAYLQEAARMNPNDVVLSSQVNFLKIRLAEIEHQERIHESVQKNRTIMVIDDSATVRKLVSGKLEKSGHTVVCAVDGIDALEKIEALVPDLILLDITMPRMDGYQVCKMIRGNEATKDVPVVMISGKDGFFDKVRGRMAGTTGYITKPFGPETLMRMVETYIA